MHLGIVRPDRQGGLILMNCQLNLALGRKRDGQVKMGPGIMRLDGDLALEERHGFVDLPLKR